MNYYERHLGDYAKDTAHLSMLEHGAYTLLLDRYYATEEGIPKDQAHRVARARSKEERAAVDAVLAEFFVLDQGIWTNRRAKEEVEKAHKRIMASKINGRKGGRPKKEPDTYSGITQQEPDRFISGYETQTRNKAYQSPDTMYQTIESSLTQVIQHKGNLTLSDDRHRQIMILLQESGVRPVSVKHTQTIDWASNPAVTDEILLAAIERARQYKPDSTISPAYLKPIIQQLILPKADKKNVEQWWFSHEGIDSKGREVGMQARPSESYADYRNRIFDLLRDNREKKGAL